MTFSDGASICFNNVRRGIYQALLGRETAVEVKFPRSPATKRHVQGHAKHVKDGVLRLGLLFASCAALCILFFSAVALPQSSNKPLTNDDVVQMVKGGLPENTIINAVQAQDTHFDVSATALIKLKQQGVSQQIMSAMIASAKKQQSSSAPAVSPTVTRLSASPGSTTATPSRDDYLPATGYRVKLLTIRDHPELIDKAAAGFAKWQIYTEAGIWNDIDGWVKENPAISGLNPQHPAITFEWQKLVESNPALAKGPLLDVFLRPDADWSFVKRETGWDGHDSIVEVFLFSKEAIAGRDATFAAQEVAPILKKQLLMVSAEAPTKLFFLVPMQTCPYDFKTNAVPVCPASTSSAPSNTDLFPLVDKPMFSAPAENARAFGLVLPAGVHTTLNYAATDSEKVPEPDSRIGAHKMEGETPQQRWRALFASGGSAQLFPDLRVLALDRRLQLSSIPLDAKTAERLRANNGGFRARVSVAVDHMDKGIDAYEQKRTPIAIMFARVEKVEILAANNEVVETLGPEKFRSAKEALPEISPAPAPTNAGRPPSDTKSFQEHQDEVKAQNRRNVEARQEKNREQAAAEHAAIQANLEKSKACRQRARDQVAQNGGDERPIFSACMKEK